MRAVRYAAKGERNILKVALHATRPSYLARLRLTQGFMGLIRRRLPTLAHQKVPHRAALEAISFARVRGSRV